MAAWQTDFTLVSPAGALSSDYRARLDEVLPRGSSWSDDIEQWGTEDGHRIDVSRDDEGKVEVFARFDMRAPDLELWGRFLGFVRAEGLEMRDSFGRPVAATFGEFALALRGSPAFRFVENPQAFLRRHRLGGLDDV